MAQSATTVTACNPTPPTNTSSIGWTAPDPSFFSNSVYTTSVAIPGQGTIQDMHYPYGGPGVIPQVTTAPYFDDGLSNNPLSLTWNETGGVDPNFGTAAKAAPVSVTAFAAAHATVTDSSGPPAITTLTPEGLGAVTVVTQDYTNSDALRPMGDTLQCRWVTIAVPAFSMSPNADHPSSLSPTTTLTPTTTGATAVNNVAAVGHVSTLTVTGTNYNRSSVVNISGVKQPTNYVSATSLTVTNAMGKQTAGAGTLPVTVTNTNSGITSGSFNWTFT